jgi:CubicO group peptidase (beta-lactamase class C family)
MFPLVRATFLLALIAAACAQDPQRIDRIAQHYHDRDQFMGTVTVARGDQMVFDKSYGYANLEWQVPFAHDTRFRIASLSKQFTAAAILLLQEDGKLKTSDPLSKYYKSAPASWRNITLRNLLTQTSGIPNYTALAPPNFNRLPHTPDELIQMVASKPLEFDPGKQFDYSNTNYVLLGYIIEQVSGITYAQFLQDRIFTPLGLKDTGYDSSSAIVPHHAYGYRLLNGKFAAADYDDISFLFAAGGLYSTAKDLVRWNTALYGGKLLKPASITEMTTPFRDVYAYALFVQDLYNARVFGHSGVIDGFYSAMDYFPDNKISVIVLSNVTSPGSFPIENELMALIADEHAILPSEGKELPLPTSALEKYIGSYKLDNSAQTVIMNVTLKDNHLYAQVQAHNPSQLRAESPNKFYFADDNVEIEFKPDASDAKIYNYTNETATRWVRTLLP